MSDPNLPAAFFEYDVKRIEFDRPLFGGGGWIFIVDNKRDFRDPTWIKGCEVRLAITDSTIDNTNEYIKTLPTKFQQPIHASLSGKTITAIVREVERDEPMGRLFTVGEEIGLIVEQKEIT